MACVDLLDVNGAGVSLMTTAGAGGIVAASNDLAGRVEEWQFSLGEGPCKEAFTSGRSLMVGDVTEDSSGHAARWPVFADRIRQAGIRAIFAFPMVINGQPIGVIDLFRDRTGLLNPEQVGVASAFAELAGALLLVDSVAELDELDGGFGDRGIYRFGVHQATGMVSVQLGVTLTEAFALLRARAFVEGRTVTELAADVVARRLSFDEDDV